MDDPQNKPYSRRCCSCLTTDCQEQLVFQPLLVDLLLTHPIAIVILTWQLPDKLQESEYPVGSRDTFYISQH